jgi:hypothetical protein
MAAKLGSDDVSFRLGAGEVAAVYLGTQEVWSAVQAVTLYFNGAVDDDWTELGNWWLNAEHTEPAGRLPAETDSVVARNADINASGQTIVNFTLIDTIGIPFSLTGTLTVTGIATFDVFSANSGTITGDATFNDSSTNSGTVTGNATFNDSSVNSGTGTVTGDATFTGSACNSGTVGGTITGSPPSCF